MKSIKKLLALAVILSIGTTSILPGITANAQTIIQNEVTNNQFNVDEAKKILEEQGIDSKTQSKLIEKKLNGELLDSENPEKLSQIPNDFYVLDLTKPFEKKRYVFEDGSVFQLSHSPKFTSAKEIISNAYTTKWIEEKVTAYYGIMRVSIYVDCE